MLILSKKIAIICTVVLFYGTTSSSAQQVNFSTKKTSFSASSADDFSPVLYKNGLVYCSNTINSSVMSLKSDDENLFDILFVEKKDSGNWKTPILLSENLTTMFNEGPSTFSSNGDTIFYARNNEIEGKLKDINDPSNTLGIFSAEKINGEWTNIKPFLFNSKEYSIGTPAISSDGAILFFASDMPGGYGGTDLYSCEMKNGEWTKPVNLGQTVNSKDNESYPFACQSGKLFFSSDRPGGFGGKDIYYCLRNKGEWSAPILLKASINSKADDYGIVTDINMDWGYFSSNRKDVTNIYQFKTEIPQIEPCIEPEPFKACFDFFDERFTDSLHLDYEWDFGHGIKQKGAKVRQCFDRPGSYSAVLTIIHKLADSVFETKSTYNFEVPKPNEDYIFSDKPAIVGQTIALYSTSGRNNPQKYFWDLNGENLSTDKNIFFTFKEEGTKEINLGKVFLKNKNGYAPKSCTKSMIPVYLDEQEMATSLYPMINSTSNQKNKFSGKQVKNNNRYFVHPYIAAKLKARVADSLGYALQFISNYTLEFSEDGELKKDSENILDLIIEQANKSEDIKLIVAVHEDQKGSDKQNLEHTNAIAQSITQYFVKNNFDPDNITSIGYGSSRPFKSIEKLKSDWKKRIEFIYMNK